MKLSYREPRKQVLRHRLLLWPKPRLPGISSVPIYGLESTNCLALLNFWPLGGRQIFPMNIRSRYKYVFLMALVLGLLGTSVSESFADGLMETDSSEYIAWKKKNLKFHKNWYSSSFPKGTIENSDYLASIEIRIAPSGLITYLSVLDSSGNAQGDFSCLESLTSNAPFEAMPKKRHNYIPFPPDDSRSEQELNNYAPERYAETIRFGGEQQPKLWPAEKAFLAAHPALKDNCYVMHLIPLGINKHYPNLFTTAELNAQSNLIAIKRNLEAEKALQPFLNEWQAFICNNKIATKNSIKKKAAAIKVKYSKLLITNPKPKQCLRTQPLPTQTGSLTRTKRPH